MLLTKQYKINDGYWNVELFNTYSQNANRLQHLEILGIPCMILFAWLLLKQAVRPLQRMNTLYNYVELGLCRPSFFYTEN